MKNVELKNLQTKIIDALSEEKKNIEYKTSGLFQRAKKLSNDFDKKRKEYISGISLSNLLKNDPFTGKYNLNQMLMGSTALAEGVDYLLDDIEKLEHSHFNSQQTAYLSYLKQHVKSLKQATDYLIYVISRFKDSKWKDYYIPLYSTWLMRFKMRLLIYNLRKSFNKIKS